MDTRGLFVLAGCAVLAYIGWENLRSDEAVEELMKATVCTDEPCHVDIEKKERRLFSFEFTVMSYGDMTQRKVITCGRPLWLVGEHKCQVLTSNFAYDERVPGDMR